MASHYINPQDIWDLFYAIYDGNEYACAGAMGNMQVESGLYSDNAENSWNSLTGYTDEWLTENINNGTIDLNTFLQTSWWVNDYGFGYGLSQWTTTSRRTKLWEFTIDAGLDIDSQEGQFNYIRWEWTNSSSAFNSMLDDMKAMTNVEDATRYYCDNYEVGTWTTSRLTYASHWYDTFAGGGTNLHIYVNVTGNGTAYVDNPSPSEGDEVTLYCTPNGSDILEDVVGETITGYSVALYVQEIQTFTMPNESIIIEVTFSGESPIPTTHKHIGGMPIWMYPMFRKV